MSILLAVIINTILVNYTEETVYSWPGDRYEKTGELFFLTTDDMAGYSTGDFACFVFEQISTEEVCGDIVAKAGWLNNSTVILMDIGV